MHKKSKIISCLFSKETNNERSRKNIVFTKYGYGLVKLSELVV